MTLPRPVYPGSSLFITRNTTQQQFLLRPDRETNNAFVYCLAVAAQRTGVDIMGVVQMSNHLHDGAYDRHGNGPEFSMLFHGLLAKCMNVHRGRWENFFATEQVCVVRLEEREDVIRKLVYIFTNPVKDGLVERVADWPGVNGYEALITGKPLRATRPRFFFAEDGELPEEVELYLRIPTEVGDHNEIVAEVKRRVEQFERDEAARRAAAGKRVVGRYAVLKASWRDSPKSWRQRRGLRPTIAALSLWKRVEAIHRNRDFINEYREALLELRAGTPTRFPAGTYWLRRNVSVDVAPFEKMI